MGGLSFHFLIFYYIFSFYLEVSRSRTARHQSLQVYSSTYSDTCTDAD